MDTLTAMRTFVAVVRAGSFTAGAEQLGISTALASKYVGRLEDRLGVRLLNRTTRSLTLTEDGAAYLDRASQVIDEFDQLEAAVQNRAAAPSGRLVISAPVTFGEEYLTMMVAAFLETYPEISIELQLTDRFVSLVDEGVDVAIRIANLTDSSLIARRLAPARIVVCASPSYLEQHGVPATPEDLQAHRSIVDTNFRGGSAWTFSIGGKQLSTKVQGQFSVNSARAVRQMLLQGAGVGLIPTYAVGEDLRAGRLRVLLEEYEALDLGIYALYTHNRHLAPKVRAFIDFATDFFGPDPIWDRF